MGLKIGDALQYYFSCKLSGYIANRVYAVHAPQDAVFPLVTFQHIGGEPLPHLSIKDMKTKADTFQIQAWGKTLEEAQTIGNAIKGAILAAGQCPADFGFTNMVPSLFKVGRLTYVRFTWDTCYAMAEKKVMYQQIGATQWFKLDLVATSGTTHTMDTVHPVGRGSYRWRPFNIDVYGNYAQYDGYGTFTIRNALEGGLEIVVT